MFAATEAVTVALPVPDTGDVNVTSGDVVEADHAQPVPDVVAVIVTEPPAAVIDVNEGETIHGH